MGKRLLWVWQEAIRGSDLRPGLRHYLLTLGTWMNADGDNCFPSAQAVADGMGVKRSTVFDMQREAIERGWLQVRSKGGAGRTGQGGTGKTNLFVPVVLESEATVRPRPTVEPAAEGTNRQATPATKRQVTPDAKRPMNRPKGGTPQPPGDEHRADVVALLDQHWGSKDNQITNQEVVAVLNLLDSGWTWPQVCEFVSANTDTAVSVGALRTRLGRVRHGPTYEASRRDRVLQGMLGNLRQGRSGPTQAGTLAASIEAHGPSGLVDEQATA